MAEFLISNQELNFVINEDEKSILINLLEQVLELLGEEAHHAHHVTNDPIAQLLDFEAEASAPEDEVLQRLLPPGYQDQSDADEFRRFTQSNLRREKQSAAKLFREIFLHAQAEDSDLIVNLPGEKFLQCLNDLRLALGVRLKATADSYEHYEALPDSDEQKGVWAVYFWLGGLQENLLNKLEELD